MVELNDELLASFALQAEQETDEVYAQITLQPEADVRTHSPFFPFKGKIDILALSFFSDQFHSLFYGLD